jgi:polysaccharide export outer membrane protein
MSRQSLRHFCACVSGILFLLALAGCGLPAAGPTATELQNSLPQGGFQYFLVKMDGRVASILHHFSGTGFSARFRGARYVANNKLRAGDTVAITVYESGGSSLFGAPSSTMPTSPAPGAAMTSANTSAGVTTIPAQAIEANGTIFMPFVGQVSVAGKTPDQIGRLIEQKLQGKAVSPQVVVSVVNNVSHTATVGGDVNQPREVPLSLRGERLLDVIAAAGGSKYPPYETYVRVVRGMHVERVLLQTVINDPSQNIVIKPDDQIYLTHNPRTFAVLGAAQKVSQYTFDTEKVTLAEAIARAGGPIDTVGDPRGIYIFRFEPLKVAKQILPPLDLETISADPPKFVPILYRIGLANAEGYFVAQSIQMRDKDVILITNAEATQLQKLLAVVRGFTGVAYDLSRPVN